MLHLARLLFKTFAFYCLVILGATFAMYTLLWASPGDITNVLCPRGCDPEFKAELVRSWGLDRPLVLQYSRWLYEALHFRFGVSVSYRQGAPVSEILGPAISVTSFVVLSSAFLTLLLSFFLAWRPLRPWLRWLLRLGQGPLLFASFAPLYILAYWTVLASSRIPHYLAQQGYLAHASLQRWRDFDLIPFGQQVSDEAGWLTLLPFFVSILLLAIGNNNLVEQSSSLRGEIEHLKRQDFLRAVRSRGASFLTHFLHNLLLPLVQFFTARAILLLGTVVIVETIMNINGIGWLLWQATEKRDTPLVLAIAVFATVLACLLQMLNEIALKLIDPRLREPR